MVATGPRVQERERKRERERKKEREICEDAIREVIDEKNKKIVG